MKARAIVVAALCVACASAAAGELRTYETGEFASIVRPYAGRRLVIHLWGVSCAPCVAELPRWGRFVASRKDDSVVFVEVDEAPSSALVRIIERARIGSAPQWRLASAFDERARYEVDPSWQGELPVTLLIDRDGSFERVAGPVDLARLRRFLRG